MVKAKEYIEDDTWPPLIDLMVTVLIVLAFYFLIVVVNHRASLEEIAHLKDFKGKVEKDKEALERLFRNQNLTINYERSKVVITLGEGNLQFPSSEYTLDKVSQNSRNQLLEIGNNLKTFLDMKDGANKDLFVVIVEGYTDTFGEATFNRELSFKRAKSIVDFWSERAGLTLAKYDLLATGYGKLYERLAVKTADGVSESRNRRVEIRIVPKFVDLMKSMTER